MAFIASLFTGPKEPKTIKPPVATSSAVTDEQKRQRAALAAARGKSSTNVVGLGNVGSA